MPIVSNKIRNFVKSRKLNMFLIFFLLAFFILILARLSANYTNTVKFNVKLKNIPDQMLVVNDTANTLNFTMTTNGFEWMKYYLKTPSVIVDFESEVKKTDSLYVWSLSRGYAGMNSQFGKDVSVKTINPDTLYFKVDINEVKMVPVKPNIDISYSPGFNMLDAINTMPDSVKVIGPKSIISELNYIETESFNRSNINKPLSAKLKLKLDSISPQINVKTKTVAINIKAEKFTEGVFALPISIVNLPNNLEINYFPKTVNLSFYTSLESYNTINESDFEVVCDFNQHNSNSSYLTPKLIKKPKAIKTYRMHHQKIEYIISE